MQGRRNRVIKYRITENQSLPQTESLDYNLPPDYPNFDHNAMNTRPDYKVYKLSDAEKRLRDNLS